MKYLALLALLAPMGALAGEEPAAEKFAQSPAESRPWCYWHWQNGHADEASITADLEAMAKIGFGGFLLSDSRGYWDDDDHLSVPAPEIEVMSPRWRELVQYSLREARRLGLKVTFNTATSGGKMCGPWKVGADAPKRLMCRVYPAGAPYDSPPFPHWREVAAFEIAADPAQAAAYVERGWYEAGDGTKTQVACAKNSQGLDSWIPAESVRCIAQGALPAPATKRDGVFVVRFGSTTVPGHEYDVDILDPDAIRAHFNRFTGAIMDEAGEEFVGAGKTIVGVYSVSWEGVVPMWYKRFAEDYRKYAGGDFMDALPVLAGFATAHTDPKKTLAACRRARNMMFCDNFYGTLKQLAAERGVIMYAENGGPWHRTPEIFLHADQLQFYSLTDMPQGEFWQDENGDSTRQFAPDDLVDRFFMRGAVSAGHVYGKRRISAESFTHMRRHWSMSPSVLRKPVDKVFADGGNMVLWHTYSLSPEKFGVPGCEYFAGTHINANVTWHDEAKGFLDYLARCQYILALGEPVVDIAVKAGDSPYVTWGRHRGGIEGLAEIPPGYNYDLVDNAAWADSKIENCCRVFPSAMRYPAERPALPDLEGPFAFCHRRTAAADIYFVQGFAKGRTIFRVKNKSASLWDATAGKVSAIAADPTDDGRTAVMLDLTAAGSAIVVFTDRPACPPAAAPAMEEIAVSTPWDVSFAFRRLSHSRHLPRPRQMEKLEEWTAADDPDLKYFSGTATYATKLKLDFGFVQTQAPGKLSLGELPSGVAHVYVNGVDCGVAWCAPWTVEIPAGTVKEETEIVVKYTNNWVNRLIGDCLLEPEERVTKSNLQLMRGGRVKPDGRRLNPYSGYCSEDPLQRSGLTGPVKLFLPQKKSVADDLPSAPRCLVAVNLSGDPAEVAADGRTFALQAWEWKVLDD